MFFYLNTCHLSADDLLSESLYSKLENNWVLYWDTSLTIKLDYNSEQISAFRLNFEKIWVLFVKYGSIFK